MLGKSSLEKQGETDKKKKQAPLDLIVLQRLLKVQTNRRTKRDNEALLPFVNNIKFFNSQMQSKEMSEESIKLMCEKMVIQFFSAGETVF